MSPTLAALCKTASQDDESGVEKKKVRRQDLLVRQQRSPACPSSHRAATPTVGLVSLSSYRVPRADDFRFPRFVYAAADPVDDESSWSTDLLILSPDGGDPNDGVREENGDGARRGEMRGTSMWVEDECDERESA